MMEIKFTGTGGAFDYEYGNSSAIVNFKGENYLIDCGQDVYSALRERNLIASLDYVLITHLHADHVGSLPTLILHHHYFVEGKQLKILYPDKKFKQDLYDFLTYSLLTPEKYILFQPLESHGIGIVDTFGLHVEGMQTYGYYFREGDSIIGYSGDLGDPDIIFEKLSEIEGVVRKTVYHEIFFYPGNPNHSYYKSLEKYLDEFEIFGYHCDPGKNPPDNRIPLVYHQKELMAEGGEGF